MISDCVLGYSHLVTMATQASDGEAQSQGMGDGVARPRLPTPESIRQAQTTLGEECEEIWREINRVRMPQSLGTN